MLRRRYKFNVELKHLDILHDFCSLSSKCKSLICPRTNIPRLVANILSFHSKSTENDIVLFNTQHEIDKNILLSRLLMSNANVGIIIYGLA